MPNVKGTAQYAVFVCDSIVKCFADKKEAVDHAKKISAGGGHAPWNYNVYKIQKAWSASK